MNRIINCGFQDNIIKKIADHAFDNYISKGIPPSRLSFVFGGRRPSLFLKRELAARLKGPFFSPSFFTMEDFMKEIISKKEDISFMPDIEAAYLIYEISRKKVPAMLGKRESFAQFLPWAYEILSFINQMDMEGVKREALLNIEANAEIGYDIPENINALLKNINILTEAFHSELAGRKMATRGLLYRDASKYAKDTDLSACDAVFFCGLFYLHGTEEEVVRAIWKSGKAVLAFQGDSSDWTVLKELEKVFSCEISSAEGASQGRCEANPDIKLYCGYDLHSQASIASHIIKDIAKPENSVLVLPEPDALMPVVTEITSVVGDFNVSLGYPVEKSSVFSLLEAVFKAQESKKGREYYTRDYLGVMLHPLAKNMRLPRDPGVTRMLVHKIEEALTSDTDSGLCGRMYINPGDVLNEDRLFSLSEETGITAGKEELRGVLAGLHDLFFRLWEGAGTFKDMDEKIKAFTEKISENSFARYYPLNLKAMESLLEISEELKNSSFGADRIDGQDLFRILSSRLRDGMVSFPGTPLKGFQVLGMLESRSLSFENVIVLNANETIMPKLKTSEPLIPREVMLGLGLSRVEKEEEIQRYEFFRLIKGAKNVHLVYSKSEENERSRFIEELLWEKEKKDRGFKLNALNFGFHAEPSTGKRSFVKSPQITNYLKTMKYTATNVNTYMDCPLRFYFRYVLALKEREIYADEPGGSEMGRFLHEFLYRYFNAFLGRKPIYDSAFESDFMKALDESFERTFAKRMGQGSFLVKEVLVERIKRFLEKERERNPRKIVALEKSYSGNFVFGVNNYLFEARVDRIDELENGAILVIDYKTGVTQDLEQKHNLPEDARFSREAIKKFIGSFQLPVYISLVQRQMEGRKIDAALYDLRSSELSSFFRDIDDKARKERAGFCLKALEYILTEINDPAVAFVPDDTNTKKCASCPFFYICR